MSAVTESKATKEGAEEAFELPAPTPAPLVLALGFMLAMSSLITSVAIAPVGLLLIVAGLALWIRQLAPGVGHVEVVPDVIERVETPEVLVRVETLQPGSFGHRMRQPEKIHPYSAGVKGGLAGGVAMALTATAYGLASGRGIWYPVNLLAGMVISGFENDTPERLAQFNGLALGIGIAIHLASSLAIGLLYGVLLPMFPRQPILWGGVAAPLLWTGAVHALMGVLNPVLERHVDWVWFVLSQLAFGLTAGLVVVRTEKIATWQAPAVAGKESE